MVKRLFLTPATMPLDEECRQIKIPSSKEWLGIFNAALLATTYAFNYEQVHETDLTPEECAEYCYQKLLEYFDSSGCATDTVDTPFWDSDSTVNDESESDVQPWYGYVSDLESPTTTFVEDAAIWAFTGLLAVSGTPAAAIAFHTIAPQFVVAVRRGELGEVIRLYLDGEEAAEVDTSAYAEGDVIEVPMYPDPEIETGHDMLIVKVS